MKLNVPDIPKGVPSEKRPLPNWINNKTTLKISDFLLMLPMSKKTPKKESYTQKNKSVPT